MNQIIVPDSSCIPSSTPKRNLNWEKCYICQDVKSEKLTCTVLFEESAVGKSCGYNALGSTKKLNR